MIDKVKTTITMSLEDYEKLQNKIEFYENLEKKLTSSKYTQYEIDEDYVEKPRVEGKKYCKFKFNAKKFIKDNFKYFNTDKLLKNMELEKIEFIIKD